MLRSSARLVPAMPTAVPWFTEVRTTGSPTVMFTPSSCPITFPGPWPIAETFWVPERLGLSAADLIALSAWLAVPWTLKMRFGHMVDTVPVFGSRRRAYVLGGALLHAVAFLALAAAGRTGPLPVEAVYVAASLAAVVGLVVQDSVADALTTEVVDRTGPDGAPRDLAEVGPYVQRRFCRAA
jgi:hypothetical protein